MTFDKSRKVAVKPA